MRTYNINEIKAGVASFCHRVKCGLAITADSIGLSGRNAHLLKVVMTHKFDTKNGAPLNFPRLFIPDDEARGLYHKNTTPNDIDLSDLETIRLIMKLMTYVFAKERNSKKDETVADIQLDLTKPHTVEIIKVKVQDVICRLHFI